MRFLLATVVLASPGAPLLGEQSFIDTAYKSEKASFVKFFAPWCSQCTSMAHDWDTLADIYNSGDKVTIAKVDCTGPTKALCTDFNVKGYPTLRYFDPRTAKKGKEYRGKRRFMDLKQFVDDHIVSVCQASSKRGCDEAQVALIQQAQDKKTEDIEKQMADFIAESDALTAEHERAVKAYENMKLILENRRMLLAQIVHERGDAIIQHNMGFVGEQ
eukprot:GEMP01070244.1.p1 GENE.GEMP01070244.1~~GEMP01070244.1.p1  ORF type:complete len:216 (+),score=50.61 GEMP01070244.1:50-697(+)